jgi:hypothetical protein
VNARQYATSASKPRNGRFATLANLLGVEGRGASSHRRLAPAHFCIVALACLALFPSVASASQVRLFAGTLGAASNPAPFPANPYPFGGGGAGHLAVDSSSHDLYVADSSNHRVEKFDAAGNFLFMLGKEVNQTKSAELGSTEAERNLCPVDPGDICQAGKAGTAPGAFEGLGSLAVDPTSGDLYVADNHAATSEVQSVTVSATGGSFTLSFEGETTAPIAFNAPGAEFQGSGSVEEALVALPSVPSTPGAKAVEVFSNPPGTYTIRFQVALKERDLPQISCNGSALSGSGSSCATTTLLQGSTATARVTKFDSAGHLVEAWGTAGQLDGSAVTDPPKPVAGPFGRITGLAVNSAGNLWVNAGEGQRGSTPTFQFDADANFKSGFLGDSGELSIDAEENLYVSRGGIVTKYLATGKDVGDVAPSKAEFEAAGGFNAHGLAVDVANGDLYIDGGEGSFPGIIKRYDSSCHPVPSNETPQIGCVPADAFGAGLIAQQPGALAIDSSTKALYVAEGNKVVVFAFLNVPDVVTTKPTGPTHTSATLTATVNPSGIELNPGTEGCRFEWGLTAAPYEHTAPCDKSAAQIGSGSSPVAVRAEITGLETGKTYHYRLVASNHNDSNASVDEPSLGQDVAFGPPSIESASAIEVTAATATLEAQVDPRNLDTHLRIEYGAEAGVYSQSTDELDIGSAGSVQSASFRLSGLAPATTYHYRLVAENVLGEGAEAVLGPDLSFTTQTAGPFSLPDSRQWEMVSPPNKLGAKIRPMGNAGVVEAAADGSALTYRAVTPTAAEPAGFAGEEQLLSNRGPAAWSTRNLGIPHPAAVGTPVGQREIEMVQFSPDLGAAVQQPLGPFDPSLSSQASESTAYLRSLSVSCGAACFRPLVTGKPGFANVPEGVHFGEDEKCTPSSTGSAAATGCGPEYYGATDDLSHIVLHSRVGLTSNLEDQGGLYLWSNGSLRQIDILPNGQVFNGPRGVDLGNAHSHTVRGAISADGSRVIWSTGEGTEAANYLRYNATEEQSAVVGGECTEPSKACTLQLDAAEAGCGTCKSGGGNFQFASNGSSRIFFTDRNPLTAGSGTGSGEENSGDLYECRIVSTGSGALGCDLTDLTPKVGAESASLQGGILGASEDGSYLYFVAEGVLAANSVDNGAGTQTAQAAQPNLYLTHEGITTFITSLSNGDGNDWSELAEQPTRVSSDGRWLELMSQRSLTGYDNRDLATGKPVAEVYLLDATTGKLRCASCNPTGARPRGIAYSGLMTNSGGLVGGGGKDGAWAANALVAAVVPGWTDIASNGAEARYQDRYLSDSGRLFFNALDALSPQDSNGTFDVYQYEPPGVGGCSQSSPTFGQTSGGCVGLISSGASRQESAFLDASENGDDVFFLTASKLVPQDEDAAYDVYDAHSCPPGAVAPCLPSPPPPAPACEGDACQLPATPPVDATPGSLTFNGAGNLHETKPKKKNRKKHHKAKKHHKKSNRAASHNRGGQK